jgi:KDO2-lipid IV(A) lauroyltransferase
MFAYTLYMFAAFLAQRLSLPTARRVAAAVGRLMCLLQRRNRRHLLVNLRTAFGDRMSERELRLLRRKVFANFAEFVAEFLWLPKINRENLGEILTQEAMDAFPRMTAAREGGKPVISLTAHLGNWELGAASAALLGVPFTTLVDFHPSPLVTAFFNARRVGRGVEIVPVTSFHKCFRALKEGRVTAIAGDRPTTGQGIVLPYFGKDALVPIGHAVLARRLGAVLIPTFLVKREDGRYDLFLDDPIEPRVTDDEEADVRECVERCLRLFETYIRTYPEQWYVFRPVWNRPRNRGAGGRRARKRRKRADS